MAKDNLDIQPLRLSDTFGLQVMVSALCQLAEFEIDLNAGFKRSQSKFFELQNKLQHYSDLLFMPDDVAEIAAKVTIRDFQFSPAELFKYQRLVFFVSDDRPDLWPLVDRETPIARNKNLGDARFLFELVDDWMAWFADKNSAPKPSDPSRYSADVKFVVFQHLTRELWGGGKGNLINSKAREYDGIRDAAHFAYFLKYGCGLSEAAAIREALRKYPIIETAAAKELNMGRVVAGSEYAAQKRVSYEVKKIKAEIKAQSKRDSNTRRLP